MREGVSEGGSEGVRDGNCLANKIALYKRL